MNIAPQLAILMFFASYVYTSTTFIVSACFKNIQPVVDYMLTISCFKLSLDTLWNGDLYNTYYYNPLCNYFYYKSIEQEIEPKSKLLISVFPHGVFCWGFGMLGGFKSTYKYYKAITCVLLRIPILGYILDKLNCVCVDKKSMEDLMVNDNNIMFLPGGFNEIISVCNFEYNIYIPIGFIILSCKHEYSILPCLSLGENETHSVFSFPKVLWPQLFKIIKKIPLPLTIPYWLHRVPIWSIMGNKIQCQKGDNPNDIRDKIEIELERIFNENINTYCDYRNSLNILPKVTPDMYTINFINNDVYHKKCE